MKQFVRIFRDPATGEIAHVHTQGSPIEFDAVSIDGKEYAKEDMELTDNTDDIRDHIHAKDILGMTSNSGKLKLANLDVTKLPPGVKIGKHVKR